MDDLIDELGLGGVADARVGDAARRGVSGGERKRVAIGHELVHEPLVLLLARRRKLCRGTP